MFDIITYKPFYFFAKGHPLKTSNKRTHNCMYTNISILEMYAIVQLALAKS